MFSSAARRRYQSSVKPTHSAFSFESLNEKMTTIASGMYRKAYASRLANQSQNAGNERRVPRQPSAPAAASSASAMPSTV